MLRNKVAHESIRSPLETVYLTFKLKKTVKFETDSAMYICKSFKVFIRSVFASPRYIMFNRNHRSRTIKKYTLTT